MNPWQILRADRNRGYDTNYKTWCSYEAQAVYYEAIQQFDGLTTFGNMLFGFLIIASMASFGVAGYEIYIIMQKVENYDKDLLEDSTESSVAAISLATKTLVF